MSYGDLQKITVGGTEYRFVTNTEISRNSSWRLNYARLSKKIRFIPILRHRNFEQSPMLFGLDQEFPFPTLMPDSFSPGENVTQVAMFMDIPSTFPIFKFYNIMELAECIYEQNEISDLDSCKHVIPKDMHCISEEDFYIENSIYSCYDKIKKFIFLPCSRIDYPTSRFTKCVLPYEFHKVHDNLCMARQFPNMEKLYAGFTCDIEYVDKHDDASLFFTWDTIKNNLTDEFDYTYGITLGARVESDFNEMPNLTTVGNQEEVFENMSKSFSALYND